LKTLLLLLLLIGAGCSTIKEKKQENPKDLLLYYEPLPPIAKKQSPDPRELKDFCGV
tara:strand:+ start:330 stop:500 length:171 start_codon:yes stop_codon:yes gene_type:complete